MMRKWILLFEENKGQEEDLARKLGVSSLLARLLINRGINEVNKAKKFLYPKMEDLYDPSFFFSDFEKAIKYLLKLREINGKILIFGDYDVDGITATTILYSVLSNWGFNVSYYIPHRLEEGYGLKEKSIKRALTQNEFVRLILTADCGIKNKKEIDYLRKNGIEVIVTDHHIPDETCIPDALLVFDPYLNNYPYPYMAGVGVAFKFLKVLGDAIGKNIYNEKGVLELVTLGTLGDMMELKDENRILVKYGLEKILNSDILGLRALIRKAGLDRNTLISTKDIIFSITPRINAVGRFKEVEEAVRLFLTEDADEAESLADKLDEFNRKRKEEVERVYEMAKELVKYEDLEKNRVVFLYSENWGKEVGGVIGVVASMLSEEYNLPFFLGRKEGEMIVFSGRGVEEVDLFDYISRLSSYLINYGGHKGAVGFSILNKDYVDFKLEAINTANNLWKDLDFTPKVKIDAEISLDKVSKEFLSKFLSELDLLPPFGPGNEEPRFKINSTTFTNFEKMGNGARYKIKIGDITGRVFSAPIFSLSIGEETFKDIPKTVDIVLKIEKEGYQGREYFNFYLEEWKESEESLKSIKRDKIKYILYFVDNIFEVLNLIDEIKKRERDYIIVSPNWNENFGELNLCSPWSLESIQINKDTILLWDDSELFLKEQVFQKFLETVKNLKNPIIFISYLKNEEKRLMLSDLLGIKNLRLPNKVYTPSFTDARFSKTRDKDIRSFEGRDVYFYPNKIPNKIYKCLVFLKPPLTDLEFIKWSRFGRHIILLFGKDEFIEGYKRMQEKLPYLEKEEREIFTNLVQNFLQFLQKAKPSEIYSLLL